MSRYQKGDANLDFTEARDSEWQWHQLGHMQVCTSLQTDNHASTTPLFLTGRMPFLPPNQKRQITEGQHIETAAEYVCWHCPRSMRSRVYASVGRPSVCLSVRLCHPAAARPCCGFAAVGPAAMRSIDCCTTGAQQQPRRSTARSSKCGQCHVVS